MQTWHFVLACALVAFTYASAEEPQMVFDIFDSNPPQAQKVAEATVVADARDLHKEKDPDRPSVRIAAALIVWNEGMAAAADHSLYRLATHPNVEANVRMDITSIHRARSAAIHSIVHHIEQEMLAGETAEASFTHVLLISQDVDFTLEDVDALIAAKLPIVSGVGLTKHVPYFPNFIPSYSAALEAFQTYGVEGSLSLFETAEDQQELYETILKHAPDGPIEALAMSYDFVLIEAPLLHRIARRSAEAHEWFWESARGDDVYLHSVGDCTRLSQTIRGKSKAEKTFNIAMEVPATLYMEEQDLCFSALAKRFGYKLHVLPTVQYGRTVPTRLSLSQWQAHTPPSGPTGLLEDASFPHHAFVVQNKLAEAEAGRRHVQMGMSTGARVVIATPVWNNVASKAAAALFELAQHPDIIGRVAIVHEEISFARNALVRKVREEFGDKATHILFVDADMIFRVVDFVRIALVDEPIVMGLAVKRNAADHPPAYLPFSGVAGNFEPLISALTVDPAPPIPIQAGGMAFTLVRMDVFDELAEVNDATGEEEWFWTEHVVDEDSHRERNLSEDFAFCRRARERGFSIFLHAAAQIRHLATKGVHVGDWLREGGLIE